MPHSPLATFEILTQATPRIFLAFDRRYRVGQVLDHLMLLLGIEHILDMMNFYQWHCRSPKWQPRLGDMSAACPLRSAKALSEL
jgi:hypothetical protein